ncbi:Imm51 family immunity protein [Dactylosporangium sp. McL0621]|uniref:Imm51 family immunity protein n=1 Tax=Dactylosporangium sp. McL0621 TaxID=3415678 RepID=UPI003CF6243C
MTCQHHAIHSITAAEVAPGEHRLYLVAGTTRVDGVTADLGHEPNGVFWKALPNARCDRGTHPDGRFAFDSEADTFLAYSPDRAAVDELATRLLEVTGDADRIDSCWRLQRSAAFSSTTDPPDSTTSTRRKPRPGALSAAHEDAQPRAAVQRYESARLPHHARVAVSAGTLNRVNTVPAAFHADWVRLWQLEQRVELATEMSFIDIGLGLVDPASTPQDGGYRASPVNATMFDGTGTGTGTDGVHFSDLHAGSADNTAAPVVMTVPMAFDSPNHSQVQQIRALLECVWPAALQTARQPFRSLTWTAALSVVVDRDGGDLTRTRRLRLARFETAVRREVVRRGRQRPCLRIVRLLFAALRDPAGVIAHRVGALERVALLLSDWLETHRRLLDTETRMTTVLDELRLTDLVTSICGLSAVGAAAILAQTGPVTRTGSPPRGRWSSTPAWHRGRTCPARSRDARN